MFFSHQRTICFPLSTSHHKSFAPAPPRFYQYFDHKAVWITFTQDFILQRFIGTPQYMTNYPQITSNSSAPLYLSHISIRLSPFISTSLLIPAWHSSMVATHTNFQHTLIFTPPLIFFSNPLQPPPHVHLCFNCCPLLLFRVLVAAQTICPLPT